MYLNRFTIRLSHQSSIPLDKLKPFNMMYSDIEDQLFSIMPKKINMGGYGYVSIVLNNESGKSDWVKEYGKCADCNLYSYIFSIDDFLAKDKTNQFEEVLNIYSKGLDLLADSLVVDKLKIENAITQLRESVK